MVMHLSCPMEGQSSGYGRGAVATESVVVGHIAARWAIATGNFSWQLSQRTGLEAAQRCGSSPRCSDKGPIVGHIFTRMGTLVGDLSRRTAMASACSGKPCLSRGVTARGENGLRDDHEAGPARPHTRGAHRRCVPGCAETREVSPNRPPAWLKSPHCSRTWQCHRRPRSGVAAARHLAGDTPSCDRAQHYHRPVACPDEDHHRAAR